MPYIFLSVYLTIFVNNIGYVTSQYCWLNLRCAAQGLGNGFASWFSYWRRKGVQKTNWRHRKIKAFIKVACLESELIWLTMSGRLREKICVRFLGSILLPISRHLFLDLECMFRMNFLWGISRAGNTFLVPEFGFF